MMHFFVVLEVFLQEVFYVVTRVVRLSVIAFRVEAE
jgi:hypothetical protein